MVTLFKTKTQAEKEAELWRRRGYDIKILKSDRPGFKYKIMSKGKRELIRLNMSEKEIREARRVGIPERIIQKMVREGDLSEREREIVREHGKVFVPGYMKGNTLVRPQLRNLSKRRETKRLTAREQRQYKLMLTFSPGSYTGVPYGYTFEGENIEELYRSLERKGYVRIEEGKETFKAYPIRGK